MVKAQDLVMRVEADPEKMKALEDAVREFKTHSVRVEDTIHRVRMAVADLEFRGTVAERVERDSDEYHDENTLQKVYDVLGEIQSIAFTPEEIVSMLQNKGILFRERR